MKKLMTSAIALVALTMTGCEIDRGTPTGNSNTDAAIRTLMQEPVKSSADVSAVDQAKVARQATEASLRNHIENQNRILDAAEAGNGRPTPWATTLEGLKRRQQQIAINNSLWRQEQFLAN